MTIKNHFPINTLLFTGALLIAGLILYSFIIRPSPRLPYTPIQSGNLVSNVSPTIETGEFSKSIIDDSELDKFLRNTTVEVLYKIKLSKYDPNKHCELSDMESSPDCDCPAGSVVFKRSGRQCIPPLCFYIRTYTSTGELNEGLFMFENYLFCQSAAFLDKPDTCETIPIEERDYCYLTLEQYTGNVSFCKFINSTNHQKLCKGARYD